MLMQQYANQKFSLESQCITISRQICSTAPPKTTSPLPQSTDITENQSSPPFLTRFKANQHFLNFSLGLRSVEREGLGMTTQYFRGRITNPLLPRVTSAQRVSPSRAPTPATTGGHSSHPPSHKRGEGTDARR